jgi:hypothetical protein
MKNHHRKKNPGPIKIDPGFPLFYPRIFSGYGIILVTATIVFRQVF